MSISSIVRLIVKNALLALLVLWATSAVYKGSLWKMILAIFAIFAAFLAFDLFLLWTGKRAFR